MRCRCGWQFDEAIVARYGCPRCGAEGEAKAWAEKVAKDEQELRSEASYEAMRKLEASGVAVGEIEERAYRKRPVVIRARRIPEPFTVETLAGTMQGKAGDWLVTGVKGEQYPVDDEIFRATYELADE